MTEQTMKRVLHQIISGVLEAVDAAGDAGAPGGTLYAAMSAHGASLSQYQSLMNGMVRAGLLEQSGDLYRITDKGRERISRCPQPSASLRA